MAMDIAPEDQDKLAQLFGGKLGGNAADLFAAAAARAGVGGARGAPVDPTGSGVGVRDTSGSAMALPGVPGGTVAPRATPQASDDPSLQVQPPPSTSPMPGAFANPKLPTPPVFQQPPVDRMQDLNARIAAASKPVLRADNQPHWWQRLLAPVAATVAGVGNEERGVAAGRNILDRNYNVALENQRKTVTPLEAEFERQGKIEPYMRDANENAQRSFTDTMDVAKETREQGTAASNAQYKSDIADIRQQIADNNLETAQKRLDETSEKNRNNLDIQQQLLAVRQQLADARDRQVDKGASGAARSGQSRLIEANKQAALAKAEDEYSKEIDELNQLQASMKRGGKTPPDDKADRDAALQRLNQKKARAQSAYEAEIQAAGGNVGSPASGATTPPAAAGAPAAASGQKFDLAPDAKGNVTKAKVQEYATIHKIPYDQAAKGIQAKGYKIQ
jgi:hypothetical protein